MTTQIDDSILDQRLLPLIDRVYNSARDWYIDYVDDRDLRHELVSYCYDQQRRLVRWLDGDEEVRVVLALRNVARMLGVTEKAAKLGYQVSDLAWYSTQLLASLMPAVLDDRWDGITGDHGDAGMPTADSVGGEQGGLVASVADVRRAMKNSGLPVEPGQYDPETDSGQRYLELLSDRLGGEYPSVPGDRRRRDDRKAVAV